MIQKVLPLITIVIPAYDNPAYTRKSLMSILAQDYRPLKVLLVDDASPNSLDEVACEFTSLKDNKIDFKYIRNKENLGANNLYVCYNNVDTDWMIFLHHDDWFVDPSFIGECVNLIELNQDINIIYANARTEKTDIVMVRDFDTSWRLVDGITFVKYILLNGHTAWSSICFNCSKLKIRGLPRPPFLIDNSCGEETGLDKDEGFSTLYLLSDQSIAITGKIVAIRGEPKSSYSKSSSWRTVSESLFFIYMGIFLSQNCNFIPKYTRIIARDSCLLYGVTCLKFLKPMLNYYKLPLFSFFSFWYVYCFILTRLRLNYYYLRICINPPFFALNLFRHPWALFLSLLMFPSLFLLYVLRRMKSSLPFLVSLRVR